MERVELIGIAWQDFLGARAVEPVPLEHRRLEQRGRRIGIVFQELGRSLAIVAQVEAPVEAAVLSSPARRDEIPERLRNGESLHDLLVRDGAARQLDAHGLESGGRRFEFVLDLAEAERVIRRLVPIEFAVDGMVREAHLLGAVAPVRTLVDGNALHRLVSRRAKQRPGRSTQIRRARCRRSPMTRCRRCRNST